MTEIKIKLESLEIEGQKPGEGDEVELESRGKIMRIDGDSAVISLTAVNGEPLEVEKKESDEHEEVEEEDELDTLRKELGA